MENHEQAIVAQGRDLRLAENLAALGPFHLLETLPPG